jgi:hypothetical protein
MFFLKKKLEVGSSSAILENLTHLASEPFNALIVQAKGCSRAIG